MSEVGNAIKRRAPFEFGFKRFVDWLDVGVFACFLSFGMSSDDFRSIGLSVVYSSMAGL